MYSPDRFRKISQDPAVTALIRDFPFATLISAEGQIGVPNVSHIPLLHDGERLYGHISRHNTQWRDFAAGAKALAVFQGPHSYISPSWYAENDVPTWNYTAVHVTGSVRLIEDFKGLMGIMRKMVDRFEPRHKHPWRLVLPDDLKSPDVVEASIIGFEITIEGIDAKFKLNQNRSVVDQRRVIEGLQALGPEPLPTVPSLMQRELERNL